jgi:hypothetical protein
MEVPAQMVGYAHPGNLSQLLWFFGRLLTNQVQGPRYLDSAQDLAGVLLFLASPAGARVTGARIESESLQTHNVARWWGRRKTTSLV